MTRKERRVPTGISMEPNQLNYTPPIQTSKKKSSGETGHINVPFVVASGLVVASMGLAACTPVQATEAVPTGAAPSGEVTPANPGATVIAPSVVAPTETATIVPTWTPPVPTETATKVPEIVPPTSQEIDGAVARYTKSIGVTKESLHLETQTRMGLNGPFEVVVDITEKGDTFILIYDTAKNKWVNATVGNVSKQLNLNMGTLLSPPNQKNNFDQATMDRLDKLVVSEYNLAILPAMGWAWTDFGPNGEDFSKADAALALARKNKMVTEGDDLVYGWSYRKNTYLADQKFDYQGQQLTIFQIKDKDPAAAKKMLTDIMVAHIKLVVGKYKGRVDQWSVVNELGGKPGIDMFMDIIGPEYIELAFQTARDADPSAKLILNEAKNDTIKDDRYEMVKKIVDNLKAKGLIDAIGLQMHIDVANPPTKEELVPFFQEWGLPVIISSADFNVKAVGGSTQVKNEKQAEAAAILMDAALESKVVTDYNFWDGYGDKYSWLGEAAGATPFTNAGEPKPLIFALITEMAKRLPQKVK